MTHRKLRKRQPGIHARSCLNRYLALWAGAFLALAAAGSSVAARTQLPAAPVTPATAAMPATPVAPPPVVVSGTHGIEAYGLFFVAGPVVAPGTHDIEAHGTFFGTGAVVVTGTHGIEAIATFTTKAP